MTTNKLLTKNIKKTSFFLKNLELYSLSVIVVTILIVILCNPQRYNRSVLEGLTLFLTCVLPGLFPFMLFTKLLSGLGSVNKLSQVLKKPTRVLFNCPSIASYVFIISITSGYPIGAKLISDLYINKVISQQDAKKMCAFCTTSGPLFVIGTVGTVMFGSPKVGIIMFVSHILASVMCGIILRGASQNKQEISNIPPSQPQSDLLSKTMFDTVSSILLVGGYITIFFLISDIIFETGVGTIIAYPIKKFLSLFGAEELSEAVVAGIIEVTRGCKLISNINTTLSVSVASALISFGGISIILQSMAFLSKCKIKARYFIFVKCVHAILTLIICFILCKLFIV